VPEQYHERSGARRDPPSFVVDDMEVSLDLDTAKPEAIKTPSYYFPADRVDRHKGNAETRHHTLLDCLGMVELHRHLELDARSLQRAFGGAPSRGSMLSHEQGRFGEQLGRDVPALRPCVSGRDDQDKLIEHSSRQTFLARSHGMPPDDAKIELAYSDSPLDGLRIRDLELHLHAGVPGPKRRNDSRQHVQPRSGAGADQERPVSQAIQVSQGLETLRNAPIRSGFEKVHRN
jgi:hypothetical protein